MGQWVANIYLFIFLFCFIYVRRIDFESREKENANFCCCSLLLDVGTLTEYKSVAEAFRAKRGSCSCSTAGTQVTCSCCQKIVGANGEFAFVCLCPSLLWWSFFFVVTILYFNLIPAEIRAAVTYRYQFYPCERERERERESERERDRHRQTTVFIDTIFPFLTSVSPVESHDQRCQCQGDTSWPNHPGWGLGWRSVLQTHISLHFVCVPPLPL